MKKNKKGFTLIEVVVVVAIMAVLATVITPSLVNSQKSKTRDKYKQYCLSALESADALCDAYNKGATRVAGYDIVDSKHDIVWSAVISCLNTDNPYNYTTNILVVWSNQTSTFPAGLTEKGTSVTNPYTTKDTIIICFTTKTSGTKQMRAVGCWYFEKNKKTAELKYDFVRDAFIGNNETFDKSW